MPDLHYDHPRLAALYDLESGWSDDRDFYLALAGDTPKRILDLGCGTGLICNAYAARGHAVTAVDASKAMLDMARQAPHGRRIAWVHCLARDFRSDQRFDLIIMTGHAFQVLLEPDDIAATFAVMRDHLSADGRIVFESRNPAIDWRARWDGRSVELSVEGGVVQQTRQVRCSDKNSICFDTRYDFADEVLVSSSTLLFLSRGNIEKAIVASGLAVETVSATGAADHSIRGFRKR